LSSRLPPDSAQLDLYQVRRYLTRMKTAVSTKGQIVIPAEIRQLDEIEAGQQFEIERIDRGEYRLKRVPAPKNAGLVDWLLACPGKGFFVPVESESTETL
jgi:AbrB family looped-hinge helix DNA binding protein